MPNNTTIELTVSGNPAVLDEFIEAHIVKLCEPDKYTDETHHFDFSTIIPRPALYERNSFSVDGNGNGWYGGKHKEKDEELPTKLLAQYGAGDWYDWCVKNWGVKWNSYDNNINTDYGKASGGRGSIQINFQTAWTIPEGIFLELMELYPELVFEVECLEESGGFAGYICYEHGFADESKIFTDMESWQEQAGKMLGYEFDENGDLI